jgi:glutamyl-tRNA reductase
MTITITIDSTYDVFILKNATLDNVSAEEWVKRKIEGNIKRLIREEAVGFINNSTAEDNQKFIDAFEATKEDIRKKKEEEASKDKEANPIE